MILHIYIYIYIYVKADGIDVDEYGSFWTKYPYEHQIFNGNKRKEITFKWGIYIQQSQWNQPVD